MEDAFVSSLALDKSQVKLAFIGLSDRPGVAAKVLSSLAALDIPVSTVVQSSAAQKGVNHIALLVPRRALRRTRDALTELAGLVGASEVQMDEKVATVSVIGTGFRQHPWVAGKVFGALARRRINLQMIVTSDLKIALVVSLSDSARAVRILHEAFRLAKSRH